MVRNMTVFFTADLHIGHANILKFCPESRPFANLDEMHETMLRNWNAAVKPSDAVHILGDAVMGRTSENVEILKQLNGVKYLTIGNHDMHRMHFSVYRECFEETWHQKTIYVREEFNDKQPIVLNHYALRTWDLQHHGAWHLFGHSHGTLTVDRELLSMDVGLDNLCTLFTPISYHQVKAVMTHCRTPKQQDHHNEETT